VSDIAGTTRDTVDALLRRAEHTYRFVDTAGIRKRSRVEYGPEFFMVNRCVRVYCKAAL
jgi:GTP-binding protein